MGSGRNRIHDPLDLQSDSHLLPDTLPTALRGPVPEKIVFLFANDKRLCCKAPITNAADENFAKFSMIFGENKA